VTLPTLDALALFDVRGKTAIVVGATGAFGKVACSTLGKAGANLVITAGSKAELLTLQDELDAAGFAATSVNLRPNSEGECDAIVAAAVDAYGGIDILVIASGINDVAPIGELSRDRFQRVMLANVEGAWLMARAAGRHMIEQGRGGKIVFTSSARGKLGHPAGYSAYCTSKSAIDGLTKALGCEWGKHGITVNAIAPTVFRSPLTAWMFEDNENATKIREGFLARVPVGRLGEPEDLAGPLLFLCSRASDFHTGHIIYADGGYTAG
jgi:NAD(P)-dependent dehydrogenase (short-subunit alcohol dehydrogenase family)